MDSMDQVWERFETTVSKARADQRITPQARQADIARAYVTATRRATELRAQAVKQVDDQRRTLTRRLFGSGGRSTDPTEAISRRDASDRAAQITDADEALHLLRRAQENGDDILAQAVARHTVTYGRQWGRWPEVLAEYTRENPKAADNVTQLQQLPDLDTPHAQLRLAQLYTVPVPAELAKLSTHSIEQLADTDQPTSDNAA